MLLITKLTSTGYLSRARITLSSDCNELEACCCCAAGFTLAGDVGGLLALRGRYCIVDVLPTHFGALNFESRRGEMMPEYLGAVRDVDLVGDEVAPRHDVDLELAGPLDFLDDDVPVLCPGKAHRVEELRKVGVFHPTAIFESEDEGLAVGANPGRFNGYVFGVEVSGPHRDVHAEFADVIKRLLTLERVLVSRS